MKEQFEWTGCGDCDPIFVCHNGRTGCMRVHGAQPQAEPVSCNKVPRGNGYCDYCAQGEYEKCRYVAPQAQPAPAPAVPSSTMCIGLHAALIDLARAHGIKVAPSAQAVAEPLTDVDTLVLRLRGRARYLRDVGEYKSAQLFDEAAQRIQPALFCPRCKVDRLTADCPNRIGCPMVGKAHGIGTKGSAHVKG